MNPRRALPLAGAAVTLLVVGGPAAWASYSHAAYVARRYGTAATDPIAPFLPLTTDGMIVAALLVMYLRRWHTGKVGAGPAAIFIIGLAATIGANLAAAHPTVIGYVVALWPPVAFVLTDLAVAMLISIARTAEPAALSEEEVTALEEEAGVPVELAGQPVYTYRLSDATGALLYVGVTRALRRRMREHRNTQPWWSEVASVRVDRYATRTDALAAERAAIQDDGPVHNVNPGFQDQTGPAPSSDHPPVIGPVEAVVSHLEPDRRPRSGTANDEAVRILRDEAARTGEWPGRNEVMRRFGFGAGRASSILRAAQGGEAAAS